MRSSKNHYSESFKRYHQVASEAYRAGKYDTMLLFCNLMLNEASRSGLTQLLALILKGVALGKLNRMEEAIAHTASAIKRYPRSNTLSITYFELLMKNGKQRKARAEIRRFRRFREWDEYLGIIKENGWNEADFRTKSKNRRTALKK